MTTGLFFNPDNYNKQHRSAIRSDVAMLKTKAWQKQRKQEFTLFSASSCITSRQLSKPKGCDMPFKQAVSKNLPLQRYDLRVDFNW